MRVVRIFALGFEYLPVHQHGTERVPFEEHESSTDPSVRSGKPRWNPSPVFDPSDPLLRGATPSEFRKGLPG